ncbi:MAG: hypothetical protein ACXVMS_11910 [Flavisolibacter sp.]
MKNNHVLAFIAAALFALASLLGFINGAYVRATISLIGAIVFLLSGIHYTRIRRKRPPVNQNRP